MKSYGNLELALTALTKLSELLLNIQKCFGMWNIHVHQLINTEIQIASSFVTNDKWHHAQRMVIDGTFTFLEFWNLHTRSILLIRLFIVANILLNWLLRTDPSWGAKNLSTFMVYKLTLLAQTRSWHVLFKSDRFSFSWTFLMAYPKANFKSDGDEASPCFRPFWTGNKLDTTGNFFR
jgi:hypothetical protein